MFEPKNLQIFHVILVILAEITKPQFQGVLLLPASCWNGRKHCSKGIEMVESHHIIPYHHLYKYRLSNKFAVPMHFSQN